MHSRPFLVGLQPLMRSLFTRMYSSDHATARNFTITYRTPDNHTPVTETFADVDDFQKSFQGWRFINPKTKITTYSGNLKCDDTNPTVVYEATHPFLITRREEISHNPIFDKAFEEKSIKCLEHHLLLRTNIKRRVAQDAARENGWRILTAETDVAEWEGIWEGSDGHVYFLEAKHVISPAKFQQIRKKFVKSVTFLNISPSMATVYVAGKYWAEGQDFAIDLGFGVIEENGGDLTVEDPKRKLEPEEPGVWQ